MSGLSGEEVMSDAVKDMVYYFENRGIVSDKYFLIMVRPGNRLRPQA